MNIKVKFNVFLFIFCYNEKRKRVVMKKVIPNILTILRILITPLIIYFGIQKQILVLIILGSIIAFTDFLDGKLARCWNVTSTLGAKLDAIGDKCLALSLLVILIFYNHSFFYVLLLEGFISVFNIFVFYKFHVVQSLLIGKLKTWVIFITIMLGFSNILLNGLIPIHIFVLLTVLLQIASLIQYINHYIVIMKVFMTMF